MDNKPHELTYNGKHYTVMANDVIKGKQEMTLQEARIIRLLITQVVKEDKDLKTYKCRIQDFANFLGITSETLYQDVRTICRRLLTRTVDIWTGNHKERWKSFQWVQLAEYDGNGTITLMLSEHIKPYVVELSAWFTQYQLQNILSFNSFYAIRLYELIKCYEGLTRENESYHEFTIEYMRTVFCCEKKYETTALFIQYVINIAVEEINEKSDISIIAESIKTGKKITSIRFHIGYNVKNNFSKVNDDGK